jgi:hypothetical protein
MIGISARPAGSPQIKLHRLPVGAKGAKCLFLAVRPEGADHQWRKIPPGELSIDPVADERLVRATASAEAS